jgi:hypothetical protein
MRRGGVRAMVVGAGTVPLLNAGLTWVAAIIVSRTKVFGEAAARA